MGWLTDITQIQVTASPEFTPDFGREPAKELLEFVGPKVEIRCLADHGSSLHLRTRQEPACKRFEIEYEFEIDSCKVAVASENVSGTLTYVGSQYVLLEADGIFLQLLQRDFDNLTKLANGHSYLLPWYSWKSRRVLHDFMESELHQSLVTLAEQDSVKKVHEHLGRVLTPEYIESAIRSLIRILKIRLRWAQAQLILMAIACSVPAVCAFARIKEPLHRTMAAGTDRLLIQPTETFALANSIISPVMITGLTLTFLIRRIHNFRVKRAGGRYLVDFASVAGIRFGRTAGFVGTFMALALSSFFFYQYPRWIDASGKLYGIVQFTNPPEILEEKVHKSAKNVKVKAKKKVSQSEVKVTSSPGR